MTQRKQAPNEVRAFLRARFGMEIVDGFHKDVDAARVISYGSSGPIAGAGLLTAAHLVRQRFGSRLAWETEPVPADPEDRPVAFVFPLALGHGAPWPQPSGRFDVSVNGSRVAGFPIVADSQRWSGAGCELLLWVRGVRAAEPGTTLQLDEVVRDESLFVDALAFLRVPARLPTPARRPG